MINPPQTLDTARLHLRPPAFEDAESIFEQYATDPAVTKYLTFRPHHDLEDTITYIHACAIGWNERSVFHWAICSNDERKTIGMLKVRIQPPAVELGYVLAQSHWGKGLMAEALAPVVGWSLSQTMLFRIWALCDVENKASQRVLEKVGMQCEGTLRRVEIHPNISPEPRDCFCYARVKGPA